MRKAKATASDQSGFTLVELMVGLVIGLLTVLVITQVSAMAEGKKRTTTMGSDAQVNGALALFTLQRDIEQSGYGATDMPSTMGCTVNGQTSANSVTFTLAPVVITAGGSGVSDGIAVLQGNTSGFSAPIVLTGTHTQTDNHFTVRSSLGAAVGNMMIAAPTVWDASDTCTLFNVTNSGSSATTTLGNTNVPHETGNSAAPWNQADFPSAGYASGSYLLNMGTMVYRQYSIDSSYNLAVSELSNSTGAMSAAQPLYPQIVMMKAMYGKDTTSSTVACSPCTVDTYATAMSATPTTIDWQNVVTIRVAVVARSNQYEKDTVTTAAPQWDVGNNYTISGATTTTCNTTSKCIALDVSALPDWQHYRYKVYDTIVPLRNVLWNK